MKITDTNPEFEKFETELIMSLTGVERIKMGLRFNEFVRKIIWASIPEDLPEVERKKMFLKRFYDGDFPPGKLEKIIEKIK